VAKSKRWKEAYHMGCGTKNGKSVGISYQVGYKIDVSISLKMRWGADLSGAGCGSSASPVLRRVQLK
jgi:hypothetical protein